MRDETATGGTQGHPAATAQRPQMDLEFTGERVIPGLVEPDLWNEHSARYRFAAQLAQGRRVLDLGCGAGYGSAILAQRAEMVIALDRSAEALGYGLKRYAVPAIQWIAGEGQRLPFTDGAFDLIVAFEVLEHLQEQAAMVAECRRVLAAGGQLLISTPNRDVYQELRGGRNPNPYHERELNRAEFEALLREHFPCVQLFAQDHAAAILIRRPAAADQMEVFQEEPAPVDSPSFLIALCAAEEVVACPTSFLYLPRQANLLLERTRHIAKLEAELAAKQRWLEETQAQHARLLQLYQAQTAEVEARTAWARDLEAQLERARHRISDLEREVEADRQAAIQAVEAYERVIRELEADVVAQVRRCEAIERDLTTRLADALARAEAGEQRADQLARQLAEVSARLEIASAQLRMIAASRWVRLGRLAGIGPEVRGV